MKLLVDTHIVLWWMREDPRLPEMASRLISDGTNQLLWSLASSWEIAVKISVGKLQLDRPLHRFFADVVKAQQMELLHIGHDHCACAATLPLHHRDPFDRMLIAQAQVEKVPILTLDPKVALYEVETLGR